MDKTLLKTDTLLFIAMAMTGFGAGTLDTDFTKGMIALLVGAGLVIIRATLKQMFSSK